MILYRFATVGKVGVANGGSRVEDQKEWVSGRGVSR